MTTEIEDSAVDPPRTTDGFFEPPAVGSADRTRELDQLVEGLGWLHAQRVERVVHRAVLDARSIGLE